MAQMPSMMISFFVILAPFRDRRACWLFSSYQDGDQHQKFENQPQQQDCVF
jgi:hypothetical protein|tara:strand:+ start:611 stop:763 length:153 start_codon:yes stop_codon:yes gene_type:complete